jgi:alpha-ketoglutarate-dependent taurine dioxygenase
MAPHTRSAHSSSISTSLYRYAELAAGLTPRGELQRALIDPGATIIEGMPDDVDFSGAALAEFAAEYLGGLQKHPRRDNAHWTISTEEMSEVANSNMVAATRGATNAYDTSKQLCNHTDQSLYGTPGLLLAFHCVRGEGNNSLTDGFAVAAALKERHPEHYEQLTTYGMNAGRHLGYYRSGPLCFDTAHKVLQLDAEGGLARVQYHESYRTPLTLPYDVFPKYMAALDSFYALVHSGEFQTHLTLKKGECLVMNNWRTMHGRAGLAGKSRTIIGGTITREAFYSAVRQTAMQDAGVAPYQEVGVPSPGLVHMGSTAEAPPAAAATTTESVRRFRAPTSEEPLSASATQEA